MTQRGARVAELSWPDVERLVETHSCALIAVAAGAKAHGPHLPVDTDLVQAEWLIDRLIERAEILVWPTLTYGHYPAFTDFPGSCSLPSRVFQDVVRNVIEDIYRSGIDRIVVLNTGISTITPLEEAIEMFPDRSKPVLASIYHGRRFRQVAANLEQQVRGSHADELETSIMLAIAPDAVDMSRAARCDQKEAQPGAFRRTDKEDPNYFPLGVYGDPTLATAEKGVRLLDAILQDLEELL